MVIRDPLNTFLVEERVDDNKSTFRLAREFNEAVPKQGFSWTRLARGELSVAHKRPPCDSTMERLIRSPMRQLIVRMVQENPTWGEERIAAELSVKLGILVSPRTVRAYWPQDRDLRGGRRTSSQHWRTFVRNHAKAIVAADFLVAITAGFRVLYVFVVMEVGSRRILQCNVTAHPTAAWTLQQFREAIPGDHTYRFLIHDRDSIFSAEVDDDLGAFGLKILRAPVQAPKANAYCERLIGSMRRECLDWVIPLNEKHLRRILREWVAHYNRGRPYASLGPGIPEPATTRRPSPKHPRHELPPDCRIRTKEVLGGLHHEYRLEKVAA